MTSSLIEVPLEPTIARFMSLPADSNNQSLTSLIAGSDAERRHRLEEVMIHARSKLIRATTTVGFNDSPSNSRSNSQSAVHSDSPKNLPSIPIAQPTNQPINQSNNQPNNQPASQPVIQPTGDRDIVMQPVLQSNHTSTSTNQPSQTNQSTNPQIQPTNQLIQSPEIKTQPHRSPIQPSADNQSANQSANNSALQSATQSPTFATFHQLANGHPTTLSINQSPSSHQSKPPTRPVRTVNDTPGSGKAPIISPAQRTSSGGSVNQPVTRSTSLARKSSAATAAINQSSQPRVPASTNQSNNQSNNPSTSASPDAEQHEDHPPAVQSINQNSILKYFGASQSNGHHSHSSSIGQSIHQSMIVETSEDLEEDVVEIDATTNQSNHQSNHQSSNQSNNQSTSQSTNQSTAPSKSRGSKSHQPINQPTNQTTTASEKRKTQSLKDREREKELKERFDQIEKRELECRDMERKSEAELEAAKLKIRTLEYQLDQSMKENARLKQYAATARSSIVELFTDSCALRRQRDDASMLRSQCEIGRVVTVREERLGLVDQWVDGEKIMSLKHRLATLDDEFKQLEVSKNALKTRKRPPSKRARDSSKEADHDGQFVRPQPVEVDRVAELIEKDSIESKRQALENEKLDVTRQLASYDLQKRAIYRSSKLRMDELRALYAPCDLLKDRYLIVQMIGKGGFSEVFQAFDLSDNCYVALKVHQLSADWRAERRANYIKHAEREYHIHRQLAHPNVVKLTDVYPLNDSMGFVTVLEYCASSDLDAMLKSKGRLVEREARLIFHQIMHGLDYLHTEHGIIHYDLKPANILFHNGQVKITDFGLSKILSSNPDDSPSVMKETDLTSQGAGTYWYLPPECFMDTSVLTQAPTVVSTTGNQRAPAAPKISAAVDMFSAGVVLYQMLTGVKPFGHNKSAHDVLVGGVMRDAHGLNLRWPEDILLKDETKDLVSKLLSQQAKDRPTAKKALEHSFFTINLATNHKKRKVAETVTTSAMQL